MWSSQPLKFLMQTSTCIILTPLPPPCQTIFNHLLTCNTLLTTCLMEKYLNITLASRWLSSASTFQQFFNFSSSIHIRTSLFRGSSPLSFKCIQCIGVWSKAVDVMASWWCILQLCSSWSVDGRTTRGQLCQRLFILRTRVRSMNNLWLCTSSGHLAHDLLSHILC